MKKNIIHALFFVIIFSMACNKNAGSSSDVLNEKVDTAAVIAKNTIPGEFITYGQAVMGVAKVYSKEGKLSLALENFSTNNGPDLHLHSHQIHRM